MKRLTLLKLACALILTTGTAIAYEQDGAEDIDYLFAWPFVETEGMSPRGGTTRAPVPEPVAEPTDAWTALQAPGLEPFERDRRAILAMAGEYRVSFDFLETVGFEPGFEPARPYRSWGTEFVEVIADEGDFISLQHILVMVFENDDGELQGPMVTKHWRQDWRYEDTAMHEYRGHGVWERRRLDPDQVAGAWSQAVYQVDDSPRYESFGRWQHHPTHSVWEGNETRRPLPRREFSVRDDYDVLLGTNRHTILPDGWIHEQDNLKTVVGEDGRLDPEQPFLAREMGVNRYHVIDGFDFSAGREYWQATRAFWALVRDAWSRRFAEHERIELQPEVDGESMMMTLFGRAQAIADGDDFDREAARETIEALFERHVEAGSTGDR